VNVHGRVQYAPLNGLNGEALLCYVTASDPGTVSLLTFAFVHNPYEILR